MLSTVPLSAIALPPQGEASIAPLTNGDIVVMVRAKFNDELIIAKINSARCHFDTDPTQLAELKHGGVSDVVLLAMISAPYGMSKQVQSVSDSPRSNSRSDNSSVALESSQASVKVHDGLEIEVQLKNNLSGEEAKIGDLVDFTVLRAVQIDGQTVVDAGASARGRVTTAKG